MQSTAREAFHDHLAAAADAWVAHPFKWGPEDRRVAA
jgi:hypothetical protein